MRMTFFPHSHLCSERQNRFGLADERVELEDLVEADVGDPHLALPVHGQHVRHVEEVVGPLLGDGARVGVEDHDGVVGDGEGVAGVDIVAKVGKIYVRMPT